MADDCVIESTCLAFHDDIIWPVFVFPDHSVPTHFRQTKERAERRLPVLLLGLHRFVWRHRAELFPYEPTTNYLEEPCQLSKQRVRAEAFEEAIRFHDLDYYHKLVTVKADHAKREVARHAINISDSDDERLPLPTPSTLKRRRPVFTEEDESDDGADLFVRARKSRRNEPSHVPLTPSPTPKQKKKMKFRMPLEGFKRLGVRDDSEVESVDASAMTPSKTPGKGKSGFKAWTPGSKTPKTQFKDHVAREQFEMLKDKEQGGSTPQVPEPNLPTTDPSKVNIYVGPGSNLYVLDISAITPHPSLSQLMRVGLTTGNTIRNPLLDTTDPETFESVISWLEKSDYPPLLLDDGNHQQLQGIRSAAQFEEAASNATLLWLLAHKLQLADLQELVWKKLEAQRPLSTASLLTMAQMVFTRSDQVQEGVTNVPDNQDCARMNNKMRDWLKQQVAERYYACMEEDAMVLTRVMKGCREVADFVHRFWLDHP